VPPRLKARLERLAKQAFPRAGLPDYARVDFRVKTAGQALHFGGEPRTRASARTPACPEGLQAAACRGGSLPCRWCVRAAFAGGGERRAGGRANGEAAGVGSHEKWDL